MNYTLDHPNIVRSFETFRDTTHVHFVTELCSGGELYSRIIEQKSISEEAAAEISAQLLSAISYLHDQKICHRDLKPENILFTTGNRIKIIDFGLSKFFEPGQKLLTKIGTPYYVSPEILNGSYDNSCDIWSIGIITFFMLAGYPPFNAKTES